MTDTKPTPSTITDPTTVDPEVPSGVAQFLSPVVIDLTALSIDGKQAHWHVRGDNFIAVHELLDTVVAHARDWADVAAERVVALGLPIDARTKTVASKASTPSLKPGFQQAEASLTQVIAAIDATLVTVKAAVEGLDELDPISQDVAIEIARGLEKDRWFLAAHLAG
jgi:starvation-inducible DNA-binding protein